MSTSPRRSLKGPQDARHGTPQGYNLGCRQDCCRNGYNRWRKGNDWAHATGRPPLIDSTGTLRRLQALMALGHTQQAIADAGGMTLRQVGRLLLDRPPRVSRPVAARVRAVYGRLSMALPPQENKHQRRTTAIARNRARREGWPLPLAWDDATIDDPAAQPDPGAEVPYRDLEPDPVVVDRALRGQQVDAHWRERLEVIDRWLQRGGDLNELDRVHGWNTRRDLREYRPRVQAA